MTNHFVVEHELAALLEDLDATANIIGEVCERDPQDLTRDDLSRAIATVNKAADFVQRSLERHIEGGRTK
jgi:hypothetical protein